MTSINHYNESVQQVAARLFTLSFVTLASLVLLADTSVVETLRVSLVVAVQVSTGATMWRLLRPRQICTIPELLGMGLALGSFISLSSSQALRATPLNNVAWALPTIIFAILIGFPSIRDRLASSRIEKTSPFTTFIIVTAALIALAFWWWWLWPIVPAPAVLYLMTAIRTKSKYQVGVMKALRQFSKLLFLMSVLLLIGMVAFAIFLREFNSNWWIFSYDQVYAESLSTSVTVWGPNENIQLVGEPLNYHWFALVWSGMTTQAGGISPWIAMTKVLPICSLFAAVCLTWTCTRAITKSKLAPAISVFVFVLASNSFEITPTRYTHSSTYIFSVVWLLGFTLILIEGVNSRISGGEFLLGLMMIASLGGKVSHGAIAFCGFALCFVASLVFVRDKRLTQFLLKSTVWIVAACVIAFSVIYRNQTIGTGSALSWGFAQIGIHAGIAQRDSSMLLQSVAWSGVLAGITPAVAPIFILFLFPSSRRRVELYYFVGALLSSLIFISIFKEGGASQLYFFLSGLAISAIAVGWALSEGWDQLRTRITKAQVTILIIVGVGFSMLSSLLWNWTPSRFDRYHSLFSIRLILPLILWTSALVVAYLLSRRKDASTGKQSSRQLQGFVASVILIASATAFGLSQRFDSVRNLGHRVPIMSNDPNLISGSKDHIAALTWLRNHSDQNDIVATNRFCIPGVESCISKWFLVSALSHRRMLIEGGYFDGAQLPSPAEEEKIKYSKDFAEHPTRQGTVWLLDHGVSWVFVDYVAQESGIRSWEPYGTTMFSNGVASIVKLNQELRT